MSAQCTKTAWLSSKLKQFALDEEIYLNYIESVLDGEEDRCEKISALEAILGEVLSENEAKTQCMEIIDMYDTQDDSSANEIKIPIEDTEETLVKMLETNIRTVVTVPIKLNSDEEDSDLVKIRKNILSQYAQKEANSEEEECDDLDIEHNTNASTVLALKKEQRERAKEQSLRKKEKDKEDREKQKQLVQEKKDAKKKKAQKVERKR
ncbi:coiled-coil domain-containing protein 43-like [Acyrthosiphon pisum]|uniref:Coiled-coil domain-containing protein 43 n=1 Tax=Acyrthosiphon pisum TaxID=7029 RepID=C4WVM4_ACYPI|nr:coiled-coil domain-containing protein 43-like [Acyrthosiphon pisum]BAH71944.1 ACYPI006766 [Acyrthosiphon pisum]|eukprot:NP_001156222.1 coiled-coil domain-containing protein 43-like [Acyrthosiphon pisum]